MPNKRRTLEELKEIALDLSRNQLDGNTPSKKNLSTVMKNSEYEYYGMTVAEFQEYCGFEPNKSTIELKIQDNELLQKFCDLCLSEEIIPTKIKLRSWVRNGKFHSNILERRFGGFLGLQERLLAYADENNFGDEIRDLPGWNIDLNKTTHSLPKSKKTGPVEKLFEQICELLLLWSPARRRSYEEAYKSELSNYLKHCNSTQIKKNEIREEKSDSLCDIAVGSDIGIEVKMSPSLSEYDRCFGQVARHLKTYKKVAVVIFDVPRQEQFDDFCKLIDEYYSSSVHVIKKG